MSFNKQSSHQEQIIFLSKEKYSLRAQITWLSIQNFPTRIIHDQVLLFLDYIQLICPILIFSLNFTNDQETVLPQALQNFARVINPGSWLSFKKITIFESAILLMTGGFVILRSLLFAYLVMMAADKVSPSKPSIQAWRYLFRVQGRVLCFFISALWRKALGAIQLTKDEKSNSEYYGFMALFSFLMALEFVFSLYLEIFHKDILPSKQFLSSKDNRLEITGLVQKQAIQILILVYDSKELSSLWLFVSVNLAFDIMRNVGYFKRLPFYSSKALLYQASLLMLLTSLNLSCFITVLLKSIDSNSSSLLFMIITWIILAILLIMGSQQYLRKVYWNILLSPKIGNANLLIHRIWYITELLGENTRENFGDEFNRNYSWRLLAINCINSRSQDILKIENDFQDDEISLKKKESFNKIMRNFLEKLLILFPKNKFVKLYTAHFYIKTLKLIRAPIDIISKIRSNNPGFRMGLNTELLLMEVQENLKARYSKLAEDKENHLNLSKFISEKMLESQAREKIISQANLQIQICNEVKKDHPNLLSIFDDSQKLSELRLKTTKLIKKISRIMSEHHIEPLLLYAQYHLVLNHSMRDNLKYKKLYSQRLQKYKKYFDEERLSEENMFDKNMSFAIFSNNETSIGKVLYASKAMKKVLAFSDNSASAMNLLKNSPPCYRNWYLEYHKLIAQQGEQAIGKTIERIFLYTNEGYLVESDLYLNIHPFVTNEFNLTFLQRWIVNNNKEYMYVLENGDIDSTTQGIGIKLGLTPSRKNTCPGTKFNLADISDELAGIINNAFNMIFYKEITENNQSSNLNLNEAQEIYNSYTTEGKDITLKSVVTGLNKKARREGEQSPSYLYNCKIINISLGKSLVKLFTFEEKYADTRKAQNQDIQHLESESPQEIEETTNNDEVEREYSDEEKKNGWIDFYAIDSRSPNLNQNTFVGTTQRTEAQLIKESCRHLLESPRDKLFSSSEDLKLPKKTLLLKSKNTVEESSGGRNQKQTEKKRPEENHMRSRLSVATSKWSKFSHQKKISYLYEISLKTKHYPKLYRLLFGLFCLAFIFLTFSQFFLKSTLEKNVEDLRISKGILRNAQLRNYLQVTIESTTRMFFEVYSGAVLATAFGYFSFIIPVYPALVTQYLLQISTTNQYLLANSSALSEEIREELFKADVKLYDNYFGKPNQTYTKLNTFNAINKLVEAGLKLKNIKKMSFTEAEHQVEFNMRNSLNDLLIKNEEISDRILSSLNSQRSTIQNNIDIFLFVLLLVFGGFLVLVIMILWQQYTKQMRNLSAFCRVNPAKLNIVLHEFINFKQDVEDEREIEYDQSPERDLNLRKYQQIESQEMTIKNEYKKDPSTWDLQKHYYLLIFRLILLLLATMIMIILTSALNKKSIKSSQTLQDQLHFVDHAKSRITVSMAACLELTATNNTAYVENQLPLIAAEKLSKELEDIQLKAYNTLLDDNQDEETAKDIRTILYGDACGLLGSGNMARCNILVARGYKPGFVYILSSLRDLERDWVQAYNDSNKTVASLRSIREKFFEGLVLLQTIATAELASISNYIDEKFEEDLNHTHETRRYIIIGYVLLVVLVSLLVWRIVLIKFRRSINRFKNVLAVLPGDLVLASFILRTFLIKTSKGTLDSIKNEF